jgi:hypothetical protein
MVIPPPPAGGGEWMIHVQLDWKRKYTALCYVHGNSRTVKCNSLELGNIS